MRDSYSVISLRLPGKGSWIVPAEVSLPVDLPDGDSTIRLFHATEPAPDIDLCLAPQDDVHGIALIAGLEDWLAGRERYRRTRTDDAFDVPGFKLSEETSPLERSCAVVVALHRLRHGEMWPRAVYAQWQASSSPSDRRAVVRRDPAARDVSTVGRTSND